MPVERVDVPDGLSAECQDELRTGVPLRGVMSASPLRPPAHKYRAGRGRLLGDSSREVDFFEEVRSQSPHLSSWLEFTPTDVKDTLKPRAPLSRPYHHFFEDLLEG